MNKYIMAIDQGTTGTTCLLLDRGGQVICRGSREFRQFFPRPGWVEHDPQEIWAVTLSVAKQVILQANLSSSQIAGIGITNQRETTVVWDKATGQPVCNAIVWQCRRTAPLCEELKAAGLEESIKEKTGLVVDAYFSATKIAWILDKIPQARQKAETGELLFGTIDSWLIWKLTGGQVHITDYSNASRTMLYNIHQLQWDRELLKIMNIPYSMMPEVRSSSEIYGLTEADILGSEIPISGAAGDQQAALFGQACFQPGSAKNTYGTGCFLLMNTGTTPVKSEQGLLTTIAWGLNNQIEYALEGSVFIAGAAIQWLRDELKILDNASESEALANSLADNGGVYMVPAFVGLGAPYWDMYARGTITGITRGTKREHLARAALEAIAFQTSDILSAMTIDSGISLNVLKVDGGAASNNFLMQFQADILEVDVERSAATESTALGAGFLAGIALDYWKDQQEISEIRKIDRCFHPEMQPDKRLAVLQGWKHAVSCALTGK
ncbi:MAG: glycerol kinase GlpK [Syntrophomonadaceae bacterium]|nr:glycerol kinase GlpK [Syntrophomonadaceae bacterium]